MSTTIKALRSTKTEQRHHGDHFGRRQPRPAPRRQGTRAGILAAATREG